MRAERRWARRLAIMGICAISFSAIFVRLANVSPSTAAVFRTGYALPVLAVIWWVVRRRDERGWRARLLPALAGVFLGIDFYFWHRSIDLIGAGLATVLGNTQVLFVGFAAWMLHGEKPTRSVFWAVPVVFGGVTLVSGVGAAHAYGSDPVLGTLFGVLTGITYTIFLLGFRRAGRESTPPAGPLLDATVGAALVSLLIGLAVDPGLSLIPTWPQHGWLIALALGSQVLGWLFLAMALPRLPAIETSVLLLMQPALTVLWALLIFSEALAVTQWIGVVLVLGGIGSLSLMGTLVEARDGG